MIEAKLQLCWKFYKSLSESEKETEMAKYLRAACECGIRLMEQRNELEQENRSLRK